MSSLIDMSPIQEEFQAVVTSGMKVLVAALESRIAPSLSAMAKIKRALAAGRGGGAGPASSSLSGRLAV